MDSLRDRAVIVINRPADDLYTMIADISRMGEWSPVCVGAEWDEPARAGEVGAQFTGYNQTPERTWQTRARVTVADPGRAFGWEIGEGWARWTYEFRPAATGGTEVTESWEFTPAGHAEFVRRFGEDADTQIETRRRAAHEGMPVTLAAIKAAAEAGDRRGSP